jgi:hypothetical protein
MTPLCYRIGVKGQGKWAFLTGLAVEKLRLLQRRMKAE